MILKRGLEIFSTLILAEGSEPILAKFRTHMMVQETFHQDQAADQSDHIVRHVVHHLVHQGGDGVGDGHGGDGSGHGRRRHPQAGWRSR